MTQIIAGFARSDRRFASQLAAALLAAIPGGPPSELDPLPSELDCTAERHLISKAGKNLGFVDLCFTQPRENLTVFVELKLHSGYGHEQLERYVAALDDLPRGRSGLLAVTRNFPGYGELGVKDHPKWLGSVRWIRVFDDLRALEHEDAFLQQLWPRLLDLIRKQGDFGLMSFDPKAVEGWARWKEGRDILTEMLSEIYEPAQELIHKTIAEHKGVEISEDIAKVILHNEKRLVWPWDEALNIQFAVPSGNRERLRLQFVGGQGPALFTTEARHEDHHILEKGLPAVDEATAKLRANGFQTGDNWGAYWTRPHSADEWLYAGSETTGALLGLVEADVRDLVASGIFEALPPKAPELISQ